MGWEEEMQTNLAGQTVLEREAVYAVARKVATTSSSAGWKFAEIKPGPHELRFAIQETLLASWARGIAGERPSTLFEVFVGDEGKGESVTASRRAVQVVITTPGLGQITALGIIPLSKRKVRGFAAYRAFLDAFRAELLRQDGSAEALVQVGM